MKKQTIPSISCVTQKKVYIFQTLEEYLVDDTIELIYQYSRQPVIMVMGHPKNQSYYQEIKAFNPETNEWIHCTKLPVSPMPERRRTRQTSMTNIEEKRYKEYNHSAITRISPCFDRLLISTEMDNKHVFYDLNIDTNQLLLVDTPCYLKRHFLSTDAHVQRNHVESLLLIDGNWPLFDHDTFAVNGDQTILAIMHDLDTSEAYYPPIQRYYPIIFGHTSKAAVAKCQVKHKQAHILGWSNIKRVVALDGQLFYVYTRGRIYKYDLLRQCNDNKREESSRWKIPTAHESNPVLVIMNHVLYIIGGGTSNNAISSSGISSSGISSSGISTCTRYDLTTETLIPNMASLNYARHKPQACVVEDKIFLFGGINNNELVREIECYDIQSNQWNVVSQSPEKWDAEMTTGSSSVLYL